ncbi:MAG TPA: hypothetical protein PLR01_10930 [Bacteroidales bacterium]|nr:hypothetical protein [Bacteroidales bacterium]
MIKAIKQISDVYDYLPSEEHVVWVIRLSDGNIEVHGIAASPVLIEGRFASLVQVGQEIWALEYRVMASFILELGDTLKITRMPYYFSLSKPFRYLHGQLTGFLKEHGTKYQAQVNQQKEVVARHPLPFGLNNVWEVLDNQTFISRKEQYLTCHALSDGSEIWRIDVGERGRRIRFRDEPPVEGWILDFFTWRSVVVALIDNCTTLGIDRTTGSILWEDNQPWFSKIGVANGKLYQTGFKTPDVRQYVIRDMTTGQIELEQHFTNDPVPFVDDNGPVFIHRDFYLVTTQRVAPRIFIFALATGELLDSIPLENCRAVPSYGLNVHGDRVYQLDMDHTLHIIEVDFYALLKVTSQEPT